MTTVKKAATKATKKAAKPVGARTSTAPKEVAAKAEAETPDLVELKTVTYLGREMAVKLPTMDQLVAWESVFSKLQGLSAEETTGDQVKVILRRCWIVINAILASEEDKDWLTDMRMEGTADIETGYKIILDATEAYGMNAPTNRAARRAKK